MQSSKFVGSVTIESGEQVEIRRLDDGTLVGLDAVFLSSEEGDAFNPYDGSCFSIPDNEFDTVPSRFNLSGELVHLARDASTGADVQLIIQHDFHGLTVDLPNGKVITIDMCNGLASVYVSNGRDECGCVHSTQYAGEEK